MMDERFRQLVESLEAMAERYETAAVQAREIADAYPEHDGYANDVIVCIAVGEELRQIVMHA